MNQEGKRSEFFWEGVFDHALGEETDRHIAEQKAAAAANPLDPRPYFHLGLLYNMQGKRESAQEMLDRALALDPTFAEAHEAAGQIYAVLGDYRRAWAHAQEAAAHGKTRLLEQLRRYPGLTGKDPG